MCATVVFDLTVAIVIGVMVSIILFVLNNSHLHIEVRDIDKDRVGKDLKHHQFNAFYNDCNLSCNYCYNACFDEYLYNQSA